MPSQPEKPISAVLREHTDSLLSVPGVVGTAQGLCDGKPRIKVLVVKRTSELLDQIPDVLGGYTVEVQETGVFQALD